MYDHMMQNVLAFGDSPIIPLRRSPHAFHLLPPSSYIKFYQLCYENAKREIETTTTTIMMTMMMMMRKKVELEIGPAHLIL